MLNINRNSGGMDFDNANYQEGYFPAVLIKVKEAERNVYKKPGEKEPVYRFIYKVKQDDDSEVLVTQDARPTLAFKPKVSTLAAFIKAITGESENFITGLTDDEVEKMLLKSVDKNFMVDVSVKESNGKTYAKVERVRLAKDETKITLDDVYAQEEFDDKGAPL